MRISVIQIVALLGIMLTSAACSRVEFLPEPGAHGFVKVSRSIGAELAYCPASNAYACTERIACEAQFPQNSEKVTIGYPMVAGFERITVVVEPEGFVSEIRRKTNTEDGDVSHSSTPCAENLIARAARP